VKKIYQYSILKYKHSALLEESVNVGILLFFVSDKELLFLYPSAFQRISNLYQDISISRLEKHLSAFNRKVKELNKWLKNDQIKLFSELNSLQKLIEDHFLTLDSTNLEFVIHNQGLYTDKKPISAFLYKSFLSHYDYFKSKSKKDEKYLLGKIETGLKDRLPDPENWKYIKRDISIPTSLKEEKFELGWQNGSLNLIAPVGFDLIDEDSVDSKAYKWSGKLSALAPIAEEKNYKFDLIVSKPTHKALFKKYDNAIKYLEDNSAPKSIYEEDEISSYLDHAMSAIKSKP